MKRVIKYIIVMVAVMFPIYSFSAWNGVNARSSDPYFNSTNAKEVIGTGNLSVGAWIYMNSAKTSNIIAFSKAGQSDFVFIMQVSTDDVNPAAFCQARTGVLNPSAQLGSNFSLNTLYYVRCRMDDQVAGTIDVKAWNSDYTEFGSASGTFAVAARQASDGVLIGKDPRNGTTAMDGRIRNIVVYEGLETDAQTLATMKRSNPANRAPVQYRSVFPLTDERDGRDLITGVNLTSNNTSNAKTSNDPPSLPFRL